MKAILNYRYWVLSLLAGISITALIAQPSEENGFIVWMLLFLASKLASVAAFVAFMALLERWNAQGRLPELNKVTKP